MTTQKHATVEEIRREIVKLDKLIEARTKLRLSLGLPAEPPALFVSDLHSRAMVDRVKVVQAVLTSYLQMINDGKQLVSFPAQTFAKHIDLLTLIRWSEDALISRYGDLLLGAIDIIEDDDNTYEKVITKLYNKLDYAQKFIELADGNFRVESKYKFDGTVEELDVFIAEYQRHYDEEVSPQLAHEKEVFAKYEAENGGKSIE